MSFYDRGRWGKLSLLFALCAGLTIGICGCGKGDVSEMSQSGTPSSTDSELEISLGDSEASQTVFIENALGTISEDESITDQSVLQTTAVTKTSEPGKINAQLQTAGKKIPIPVNAAIGRVLAEQTEIEFIDVPLADALNFLSDLHNIKITIDVAALTKENIGVDHPVSHVLSGITLRSVLNIILEPLKLTFIPEKNGLKIITGEIAPGSAGAKVTAALAKKVELEFVKTSLQEVLQLLSDQHRITFVLDEPSIDKAGVTRETTVTQAISNVTLAEGLKKILQPLGLTYRAEDEVVKITAAP